MTDLRSTIVPKSDQLNADDLIGTTKTIKITKVSLAAGEQPIAISFEGDNGKPYLPCKSMRRVLVNIWGVDGNTFVGKSLTLYRDDKVTFGGLAVGGIRISHMSHITEPVTMALTATRANRKPFTVKPLVVADQSPATITGEQNKLLRTLLTSGKVSPDDFKSHFKIDSSLDLLSARMDEAVKWIKANSEQDSQPGEDG